MKRVTLFFNDDNSKVKVVIMHYGVSDLVVDRYITRTRSYRLQADEPSANRLGRILASCDSHHYGAQQGWGESREYTSYTYP